MKIGDKIKIGRNEYEIKKGDYILDNGSCFQFMAGDGRVLRRKSWSMYSNVMMPKSLIKKVPFSSLEKIHENRGIPLIYWFFKE